jgi:hypothetical protein
MNLRLPIVFSIATCVFFAPGTAGAGGKPDGARCHVHKSCESKFCLRENPLDKFGFCCNGTSCAEANAQCGSIDSGCGVPIDCGECDPGSTCDQNQCVPLPTTTTTIIFDSCAGQCGGDAGNCWCDADSCIFNDGCPDRDVQCPGICDPPGTTTTNTNPTTTTTNSTTTTTNSVTTTTGPGGCGPFECGTAVQCGTDCYAFQTPEESCGTCMDNFSCNNTPCTTSEECGPGNFCAINSCCGPGGVCTGPCPPPSSTTTTLPPTTTTTPPTTSTTLLACENASGPACAGTCISSTAVCVEWQPGVCLCLE